MLLSGLGQSGTMSQPDEDAALSLFRGLVAQWDGAPDDESATTRLARALRQPTPSGSLVMRADWCDFAPVTDHSQHGGT